MGGVPESHPERCLLTHPADPRTVSVNNFPPTQPVSGTVAVSNHPSRVTADRGTGWPESGTTPASSAFIENSDTEAVPVRLANTSENYMLAIIGALAASAVVGSILFKWTHR